MGKKLFGLYYITFVTLGWLGGVVVLEGLYNNVKIENMIWLFIILVVITSFIIGIRRFIEMDIILGIKDFSNPYLHIGVSFEEHDTEDPEFIEQELIIGLFFINIIFVFYKEK